MAHKQLQGQKDIYGRVSSSLNNMSRVLLAFHLSFQTFTSKQKLDIEFAVSQRQEQEFFAFEGSVIHEILTMNELDNGRITIPGTSRREESHEFNNKIERLIKQEINRVAEIVQPRSGKTYKTLVMWNLTRVLIRLMVPRHVWMMVQQKGMDHKMAMFYAMKNERLIDMQPEEIKKLRLQDKLIKAMVTDTRGWVLFDDDTPRQWRALVNEESDTPTTKSLVYNLKQIMHHWERTQGSVAEWDAVIGLHIDQRDSKGLQTPEEITLQEIVNEHSFKSELSEARSEVYEENVGPYSTQFIILFQIMLLVSMIIHTLWFLEEVSAAVRRGRAVASSFLTKIRGYQRNWIGSVTLKVKKMVTLVEQVGKTLRYTRSTQKMAEFININPCKLVNSLCRTAHEGRLNRLWFWKEALSRIKGRNLRRKGHIFVKSQK